jgi:hypothetical protein
MDSASGSTEARGQQGLFFAFPIAIGDIGGTAQGLIMHPSPWGIPLGIGIYGTSGNPAEPTMWIALEHEVSWLRPSAPLDKSIIELMHAQRYAADCRAATGSEPYLAIEENPNDPPDFIITNVAGSRMGLECAVFSIEERRGAQALFNNLRSKLVFQQRHRTGHLTGCSVIVWFGKDQSPDTRPPKKSDDVAVEELIQALSKYTPDIDSLRVQFSTGMPPEMPSLNTGNTTKDATFYAIPFLGSAPSGPFASISGYEIELAYTTTHTASSVSAVMEKLVSDHDQDGVDTLLITSGGPDRNGMMHPLEQVLSDFYLENPKELQTNFIKSVILHRWPTGDAYELLANPPKKLWPQIYREHTPSHQPFMVNQTKS